MKKKMKKKQKKTGDEVKYYGGQGGAGYFSLKNDKDIAQVRIMYNDINDVQFKDILKIMK